MSIKISQLGNIGALQGNTLIPIVANVAGTLTTLQSSITQLQTYILNSTDNVTAETYNFPNGAQIYSTGSGTGNNYIEITANINNDVAGVDFQENGSGQLYTGTNWQIISNTAGSAKTWNFDQYGNLTFPDNTVQPTAFSNTAPIISTLLANAATQSDLIIAINANVAAANVGMKGYVDQGNIIQASAITSANVGMLGYVNALNTTVNANVTTINNQIANIATYSNVNVRSYLNSVNIAPYSNVNVAVYLTSQNITSYGNTQVVALLNTAANINAVLVANVTAGAQSISPGNNGNVLTSNGTNWYSNALPASYSNVQVAAYLAGSISTGSIAVSGNVTATSGNVWAKYIKTTPSTVANLGYANIAGAGARAFVIDANTIIFNSVISGGAGNNVPVFSDGTNWRIG
jgi:hypothetical protein